MESCRYIYIHQVLPSDLFGWFNWPFQGWKRDLHLGDQKVTDGRSWYIYIRGTLNNHFLMDVWWYNHFYVMIPIETTIKNWLFGVPGIYTQCMDPVGVIHFSVFFFARMSMKSSPHIVHLPHVVEMVLWSPGAIPCLGVIVAWCPGHSWRGWILGWGQLYIQPEKNVCLEMLWTLRVWYFGKRRFFFFQLDKFLACLLSQVLVRVRVEAILQ